MINEKTISVKQPTIFCPVHGETTLFLTISGPEQDGSRWTSPRFCAKCISELITKALEVRQEL